MASEAPIRGTLIDPPAGWRVEEGAITENGVVPGGPGDVGRVVVEAPAITASAMPGQFVMLRAWAGEPLLPRAMAPVRFERERGRMEIIYRIKGPGTRALAAARPGAPALVTGPLGRAVGETFAGQVVALVGRGVGITPLLPLARSIVAGGGRVRTYLSARTAAYLFGGEEFATLGPLVTQVDDDPAGPPLVTDRLAGDCRRIRIGAAFVCGARRLLRATRSIAGAGRFPAFAFLESKMGCGIGYCKGCPWPARGGGYRLVCNEGPLFPLSEVEIPEPGEVHAW